MAFTKLLALITGFVLLVPASIFGQPMQPTPVQAMKQMIDSSFVEGIENKLIPGGIVAFVSADEILMKKSYGYANVEKTIPVDSDSTLFQLGSVGKIFTSLGVLKLREAEKLSLDDRVNTILTEWGIENTYDKPVTIFNLLTHTSGLGDRNIGFLERNQEAVEPLGKYLKENLPNFFQPPGKSISYSNFGYGLAGLIVEKTSGSLFQDYMQNEIMKPLNLNLTTYLLPDNYRKKKEYAIGYQTRKTFNEVDSYPRSLLPAGSLNSTAKEMAIFLQALLRPQGFLNDNSMQLLFNRQFTNHPSLPGMSIAFEEQLKNGYRFWAKGGQVPGFISFVLILPDGNHALFVSVNTETDNFTTQFIAEFFDQFYPQKESDQRVSSYADAPYSNYEGSYRNMRTNHGTLEELFSLMMSNKKVTYLGNEVLGIVENNRYQKYKADNDSVFYKVNSDAESVAFTTGGHTLYHPLKISGLRVPATYEKVPTINSPDFINEVYPFLLLPIPLYLLIALAIVGANLLKRKGKINKENSLSVAFHTTAIIFAALFIIDVAGFFIPLINLIRSGDIFFGLPEYLANYKFLHWFILLIGAILVCLLILSWFKIKARIITRFLYTIYVASCIFFMLILYKWNFLSVSI